MMEALPDPRRGRMRDDYTHISVILDRTGSMESIRDDTIGGFNSFLQDQKKQEGKATLTLVQFDSQDPYEVIHHFKSIEDVPELDRRTFVPRASTPLLDALGRGINDLENSLARMNEENKPSKIVFVAITDGQENASREFRRDQIAKMIEDRKTKDHWQFVFLTADPCAMEDAMSYGVPAEAAFLFSKSPSGTRHAWAFLSKNLSDYRSKRKETFTFADDSETKNKLKR
jgi:hypothetical protein